VSSIQASVLIVFIISENVPLLNMADVQKHITKKESKNDHQSAKWNVNYIKFMLFQDRTCTLQCCNSSWSLVLTININAKLEFIQGRSQRKLLLR